MDRDMNVLVSTPTPILDGAPGDATPPFKDDPSGNISPKVSEEERVFALLFGQCDTEGVGLVDTKKLVGYIRNMQLQYRRPEGEELFESHDSSGTMDYDLELLQSMLECNCDENNMVNEPTYSFIIRKWVSNVRDRTPASPPEPLLEVSQLTDSSLGQEDEDISFGSYGLDDSHNSRSSRVSYSQQEWTDLVSKYQHEVKVLNERNKELMRQYDGSEESLKDHQSRNLVLQQKLVEAQASAVKLKDMQSLHAEVSKVATETQKTNEELAWAKEKLNREMERVKEDLEEVKTDLVTTESDRDSALEELKTIQQLLYISKETEKEIRAELEIKLGESRSQLELKNSDLCEANAVNSKLNAVISDLEAQLLQAKSREKLGPFSSTPYRHTLSLHEEIHGQDEDLMNRDVPISPLKYGGEGESSGDPPPSRVEEISRSVHKETHVTPAIESFTRLMEETDTKINWKHSLILRDLNDLLPQQSPSTSYRGGNGTTTTTSIISQEGNSFNQSSIESKLMSMLRKKNQFKNDNMNLKKENEDLKTRLAMLEEVMAQYQYQQHTPSTDHTQETQRGYSTATTTESTTTPHVSPAVVGPHQSPLLVSSPNYNRNEANNDNHLHIVFSDGGCPNRSGRSGGSPNRSGYSGDGGSPNRSGRSGGSPNRSGYSGGDGGSPNRSGRSGGSPNRSGYSDDGGSPNRIGRSGGSPNRSGYSGDGGSPNRSGRSGGSPNRSGYSGGDGGSPNRSGRSGDSPNRSGHSGDGGSPNRIGRSGDSPDRSGRSGDGGSLNRIGRSGDSPNRSGYSGDGGSPNRIGRSGDSPNRSGHSGDSGSPNRSGRSGDGGTPNRSGRSGGSPNRSGYSGDDGSLDRSGRSGGSPNRSGYSGDGGSPNRSGRNGSPNRNDSPMTGYLSNSPRRIHGDIGGSPRTNNSYVGDSSRGSGGDDNNTPRLSDGGSGRESGGGGGTYGTSPSFIAVNVEVNTNPQTGGEENEQQRNTTSSTSPGRNVPSLVDTASGNDIFSPIRDDYELPPSNQEYPATSSPLTNLEAQMQDGDRRPYNTSAVVADGGEYSMQYTIPPSHSVRDDGPFTTSPGTREEINSSHTTTTSAGNNPHPSPPPHGAGNISGASQTSEGGRSSPPPHGAGNTSVASQTCEGGRSSPPPQGAGNTSVASQTSEGGEKPLSPPHGAGNILGASQTSEGGKPSPPRQIHAPSPPRQIHAQEMREETDRSIVDSYLVENDCPNLVTEEDLETFNASVAGHHHHYRPPSPVRDVDGSLTQQNQVLDPGYAVHHTGSQTDENLVLSDGPQSTYQTPPTGRHPLPLRQSETQISDFVPCNDGDGKDLGVFEVVERAPSPSLDESGGIYHTTLYGDGVRKRPVSAAPQASFGRDNTNGCEPSLQTGQAVQYGPPPPPDETARREYYDGEEPRLQPKLVHKDGGEAPLLSSNPIGNCFSQLYRVLKGVVLMIFLVVLLLTLFVLIVLSHDAVERCGSHCPHSPVQLLYSTLDPYIHFTREFAPI